MAAMGQKGAQAEASLSSEKEGEGQGGGRDLLKSLLPPRLYRGIAGIGGLLPKDEEQRDIPLKVCVCKKSRRGKTSAGIRAHICLKLLPAAVPAHS